MMQRDRASALGEFGLEWWTKHLVPVCDEFVNASMGRPDARMWQSFVKLHSGSGGDTVTGWINALFPYVSSWRDKKPTERNKYMDRATWEEQWGGVNTDHFPSGFGLAPFIWEYYGQELPMKFVAGFAGVAQDPSTRSLRAATGWAVADADAKQAPVKEDW